MAACGGVLASNAGLCGGMLPPCYGSRDTGLPARPRGSARLRRIAVGWLVGMLVVVAAFTALLGGRRWYVDGAGCCDDENLGAASDAWPWRLMAFERLGFTSTDVLACIKQARAALAPEHGGKRR